MNDDKKIAIHEFPVADIKIQRENDSLYGRFNVGNFDDRDLFDSISAKGILEPVVLSEDLVLLSGHRRMACAKRLGLKNVPARIHPIRFRGLSEEEKLQLLAEFNRQRDKSSVERIRETIAQSGSIHSSVDLTMLKLERRTHGIGYSNLTLGKSRKRPRICSMNFLEASIRVIEQNRKWWPMTVRRVHYLLLNAPPLRHDKKLHSTYANDQASYKALTSLLTRARLDSRIPMQAIEDPTRPVLTGGGFDSVGEYLSSEARNLFVGYRRDLQQGQPNHIEVVLEKTALRRVIEEVAEEYGVPVTTSRGYLSLPPKAEIARRFKNSGKERLVLLLLTDFDPDGEEIAVSTARSLRDDFKIKEIHPLKVGLTVEDVQQNDLPSDIDAKPSSAQYKKFLAKYHTDRAVELDAAPAEFLQEKLRDAIEENLDIDEYNRQLEIQNEDNRNILNCRNVVIRALRDMKNGTYPDFFRDAGLE